MTEDNLFTDQTAVPSQSQAPSTEGQDDRDYFQELVGEGKKFKNPTHLAKSVHFKDEHIQRLEAENRALREESETRQKLSELVDKLATTPSEDEHYQAPQQRDYGALDEILEQKLNERDQQKRASDNINAVKTELKAMYGDKYVERLKEATEQLRITPQALNALAAESPQAVLRLFGSAQARPQATPVTPPSSSVNVFPSTKITTERTMAFYDEIKAKDPKRYWSQDIQAQMHQDAVRLGDKFFNTA